VSGKKLRHKVSQGKTTGNPLVLGDHRLHSRWWQQTRTSQQITDCTDISTSLQQRKGGKEGGKTFSAKTIVRKSCQR